MTALIRRCHNCDKSDFKGLKINGVYYCCSECGSRNIEEIKLKGNQVQRKTIRAGYDQIRPGLYLHFSGKKMILHKARGATPWELYLGDKRGWLLMFSFETLSDCLGI